MNSTYVFQYGKSHDGFQVQEGTEFLVYFPVLKNGQEVMTAERRVVSGESYGFGSGESYEAVTK